MDETTEQLYESLDQQQLLAMKEAFEWDLAHGAVWDFATGRLELIARILATRGISSAGM